MPWRGKILVVPAGVIERVQVFATPVLTPNKERAPLGKEGQNRTSWGGEEGRDWKPISVTFVSQSASQVSQSAHSQTE